MIDQRPYVVFAPISGDDLARFRRICRRRQRTTEFLAGEALRAWIDAEDAPPSSGSHEAGTSSHADTAGSGATHA